MTATTTTHAPWCDHKDDDENPVHECHAILDVDLSRYQPVQQSTGDPYAVTWQVRPNVSLLLSHASLGSSPYVELAIHNNDDQSVALTVAEAAQLAAALSLLVAKAGTD